MHKEQRQLVNNSAFKMNFVITFHILNIFMYLPQKLYFNNTKRTHQIVTTALQDKTSQANIGP